jgi:dTMP kinase
MPQKTSNGRVIMFDGPEWIGKTTQLGLAADGLRRQGYAVWSTRVSGGTPIGEALRTAMFGDYERPPLTDLHIHLAQQYALEVEINKHRQAGELILVDRSPLSIIAYQVYGGGLDEQTGYQAADILLDMYQPELLITYTAPAAELEKRRQQAKHATDYYENKPADYFERVTAGYQAAEKRYKTEVIDASGDIDSVHAATMRVINSVLN